MLTAILGATVATAGNLFALSRVRLGRVLAGLALAQVGYVVMAVSFQPLAALPYPVAALVIVNLGGLAIAGFIRRHARSDDLRDCRGLVRRSPWLTLSLVVCLLGMFPLPPTAGFVARFELFGAIAAGAGRQSGDEGGMLYALLGVGLFNTILGAVCVLRVLRALVFDLRAEELEGQPPPPIHEEATAVGVSAFIALMVLVLGILAGPATEAARTAVGGLP